MGGRLPNNPPPPPPPPVGVLNQVRPTKVPPTTSLTTGSTCTSAYLTSISPPPIPELWWISTSLHHMTLSLVAPAMCSSQDAHLQRIVPAINYNQLGCFLSANIMTGCCRLHSARLRQALNTAIGWVGGWGAGWSFSTNFFLLRTAPKDPHYGIFSRSPARPIFEPLFGDPRERRGYVALPPTCGPPLTLSPCLGTPKNAGVT